MNSSALVIFGITSNLAQIKLIPALYDMEEKGLLAEDMVIIGNARKSLEEADYKKYLSGVLHTENIHHKHPIKKRILKKLLKRFYYVDGHLDDPNFYKRLKEFLNSLKGGKGVNNIIYYLATYPELYKYVFKNLNDFSLNKQISPKTPTKSEPANGWVRLMIEKPIGNDRSSAKELNKLLSKYFTEDQIYRLDHYLGKETLQNILAFRFANEFFEPIINKNYIDHIQITAAESFGIGKRGGYYDSVGALKDVGQNHLVQMIVFATMNSPKKFTSKEVSKERLKILKNLIPKPEKLVFGQYKGYTKEEKVFKGSVVDTFFAFETEINNPRFKGVPIFVRAGKKLAKTVTEITVIFKEPITTLFKTSKLENKTNILVYRITPNEAIVLKIFVKKPGETSDVKSKYVQYNYPKNKDFHALPDPYEKLIIDAFRGDQTFFNSAAEVEAQWAFVDKLIEANKRPIVYDAGSWGPKEAGNLLEKSGREWLEPSEDFC